MAQSLQSLKPPSLGEEIRILTQRPQREDAENAKETPKAYLRSPNKSVAQTFLSVRILEKLSAQTGMSVPPSHLKMRLC
jgi:hypothetical protein